MYYSFILVFLGHNAIKFEYIGCRIAVRNCITHINIIGIFFFILDIYEMFVESLTFGFPVFAPCAVFGRLHGCSHPSDTFPHVRSALHSFLLKAQYNPFSINCTSIIIRGVVM